MSLRCFYPKSGIRIWSVFLLYIERIFVRFFAGITGYVKKNLTKTFRKAKDRVLPCERYAFRLQNAVFYDTKG